jgi:hypothetical protein
MAYFIKTAEARAMPLFESTFSEVVKWALKAQKTHKLHHAHYEIHGAELKHDRKELVCEFYPEDFADDLA